MNLNKHSLYVGGRPASTVAIHLPRSATKSANPPIIVCFPAMGVQASYYQPLVTMLNQIGYGAAITDLRGHGEYKVKVNRGNDFGYREMLEEDWPAAIDTLAFAYPKHPLFMLGHSLGGQLSSLFLSANPHVAKGLILIATGSLYFKGWSGIDRYKMLFQTQFARFLAEMIGYFPGEQVGFAGTEARRVIRDWSRTALTGQYRIAGSQVDYEAAMMVMPHAVLALSLVGDDYAPRAAMENLLKKMPLAQVNHHHLSAECLGVESISHFSWVKQSQAFSTLIEPWLERVCAESIAENHKSPAPSIITGR